MSESSPIRYCLNSAEVKPCELINIRCAQNMSANGQLNRKVKMVREPKSILDMVIPCLKRNKYK